MTANGKASVHVILIKSDLEFQNKNKAKHVYRIVTNVKKSTASSSQVPKNRVSDVDECAMPTTLEM